MEDFMCNVLIMGKTGTGKSTLLNYLCETDLAQTGTGKPVTEEGIYDYVAKIKGQEIRIFDSWGIEAGKVERWKDLIKNALKQHGVQCSIADWFHSVIYCVQAGGGRVEDVDVEIKCYNCDYEGIGDVDDSDHYLPMILCPKCESHRVNVLNGKDVTIKNISIEKEDEDDE